MLKRCSKVETVEVLLVEESTYLSLNHVKLDESAYVMQRSTNIDALQPIALWPTLLDVMK